MTAGIWSPHANSQASCLPVFGYLRLPSPRPRYVWFCRERFAAYSAAHGLRITRVFIDDCVPDSTAIDRPAWGQLRNRLQDEQVDGVLLMRTRDLSADDNVAYLMAQSVWEVGGRLFTVRGKTLKPDKPPAAERALTAAHR